MNEYKETCHDKILWNEISQLHEATLQISDKCFGYKKMCISLIVAGCAFIAKFNTAGDQYQWLALFTLLTAIGFWICDATAYFFQKSTRKAINAKLSKIASQNEVNESLAQYSSTPNWRSAFINSSMSLYLVLIAVAAVFWILGRP